MHRNIPYQLQYRPTPIVTKDRIMATPTEFIKLTGTWLRETDKAIHFRVAEVADDVLEEERTFWFSFSQISSHSRDPNVEGKDIIKVAKWICVQKELV